MRTLSRDQFLGILDITSGAFDAMQHDGSAVLAFGSPLPGNPGNYLDLDLVAMAIRLGLTPSIGREYATAIVGGYFNQWAAAVGHAEAEPGTNYFMAIGGVRWSQKKKGPEMMLVTNGTLEQIAADFRQTEGFVGSININISDILARIRRRASELGITLDRPMFFAPGDARFGEIVGQVENERDARIERLRRDKKKFWSTRKRTARKDLAAVPRVRDNNYPIEITAS
jgi:hypothetical protein